MFLMEASFASVMALRETAVFTLGFHCRGPWSSVLTFFLIVFLAAWAGSQWHSVALQSQDAAERGRRTESSNPCGRPCRRWVSACESSIGSLPTLNQQ